jgi:hypothetical protein
LRAISTEIISGAILCEKIRGDKSADRVKIPSGMQRDEKIRQRGKKDRDELAGV